MREDFLGRIEFNHLSQVEESRLVAYTGRLLHAVCHDDDRSLVAQLADEFFNLGGRNWVEGRSWFVHQQNRRFYCHGAGNAETLLLTAGEGVGRFFQFVLHFFPQGCTFQGSFYPVADEFLVLDAVHPQAVCHVFETMPTFFLSRSTSTDLS